MNIFDPIPIRPDVKIESNTGEGTFACRPDYSAGPPERGIDYEKDGRSFSCNYCPVTLSTRCGIEDHIQERHSKQRAK